MLDFTFSGILQIDAEGIIRRGNRVLYNILDKQPENLIGRPVQEILEKQRQIAQYYEYLTGIKLGR